MLIYDHNKTFLGIDDEDLRLLGFSSTAELLETCDNIADLFVKKPGYIHNFKNFQWIDFVLHSDSEHSKAIVDTGTKSFSCDIVIKPFHLVQAPGEQAYAVHLQHVKPLSSSGAAPALSETAAPQTPSAPSAPAAEPAIAAVAPSAPIIDTALPEIPDELPRFDDLTPTTLNEPESIEIPEGDYLDDPYDKAEDLYPDFNKPLEIEDDIFVSETPEAAEPVLEAPEPLEEAPALQAEREEKPMLGDYLTPKEMEYAEQMKDFDDYVYDPHIAADELGLPVDLIEEFIGDFINQSHEFHDDLFEAAAKADFENVKLLSHKLKGVAANLRIEDSFEMLSVINNSHEEAEVEAYLKMFYRSIAKLEGKEVGDLNMAPAAAPSIETAPVEEPLLPDEPVTPPTAIETAPEESEDDLYAFEIKEALPVEEPAAAALDTTADDDLYAFETAPEPAPFEESDTFAQQDDDIYSFEKAPEPLLDEAPYSETLPEEPAAMQEEDLYAFETVTATEDTPSFDEAPEPFLADEPSFAEPEPALPAFDEAPVTPEEEAQAVPAMHYDMESAANELGLPKEVVEELVNDFKAHANDAKISIETAIDNADATIWRNEAAQMKGIADNLRMGEIATALQELQSAADPQSAKAAADGLYSRIDQL